MNTLMCLNISRVILPAVRINIAKQLDGKYDLRQIEIARRLGVAQVAVSKYLSGKYSESLKKAVDKIERSGIVDSAVIRLVKMDSAQEIDAVVNELCTRIATDNLVN